MWMDVFFKAKSIMTRLGFFLFPFASCCVAALLLASMAAANGYLPEPEYSTTDPVHPVFTQQPSGENATDFIYESINENGFSQYIGLAINGAPFCGDHWAIKCQVTSKPNNSGVYIQPRYTPESAQNTVKTNYTGSWLRLNQPVIVATGDGAQIPAELLQNGKFEVNQMRLRVLIDKMVEPQLFTGAIAVWMEIGTTNPVRIDFPQMEFTVTQQPYINVTWDHNLDFGNVTPGIAMTDDPSAITIEHNCALDVTFKIHSLSGGGYTLPYSKLSINSDEQESDATFILVNRVFGYVSESQNLTSPGTHTYYVAAKAKIDTSLAAGSYNGSMTVTCTPVD